eukprot:sb/3464331/
MRASRPGEVVDIEWGASDSPLIITDTGSVRIMDINLSTTPTPMHAVNLSRAWMPFMYEQKIMMNFKIALQHWNTDPLWTMACPKNFTPETWDSLLSSTKDRQALPDLSFLDRCLVVASQFGDSFEWRLWQVLAYYLDQNTALSPAFDLVQDNQSYLEDQLRVLTVQEKCKKTYRHRQLCIHKHIFMGHTDKPVQLLLEAEQGSANFYQDSLRASLISSVSDSEVAQSTIKLVATNLIANDHVLEGCQLLCLIKKSSDACRLPSFQAMKSYIDYLVNRASRHQAILLAISLGLFERAADLLLSTKLVTYRRGDQLRTYLLPFTGLSATDTRDRVFVEYAKYMVSLNNIEGAMWYCEKAGEKGAQLGGELKLCASRKVLDRVASHQVYQEALFFELVFMSPTQMKMIPIDRSYQGDQNTYIRVMKQHRAYLQRLRRYEFLKFLKFLKFSTLNSFLKFLKLTSKTSKTSAGPPPSLP